jgi:hypothetical protein
MAIKLQPRFESAVLWVVLVTEQLDRLDLPARRGRVVARLGVRRGERVEVRPVSPPGQIARSPCVLQREPAVAVLAVRDGGPQPCTKVPGLAQGRMEAERFIEIGEGFGVVAAVVPGAAAVVEKRRFLGIDSNGLIVVGKRTIECARSVTGECPVLVSQSVVGLQTYGLGVVGDGGIEFSLALARQAAVVEGGA